MTTRPVGILAALLLAAAIAPATALGDGDPASDVLLGENVFYPYNPTGSCSPPPAPCTGTTVSPALQKTLNAETAAASRAGFPIKVALIASPVDLGAIPDLFGKAQKYADFLDQEISFQGKQRLLVVMSTGFGVQGLDGPATAAVAALPKPAGKQSDDLARAAITAVAKLATAYGHPIKGVAGIPGASGGGSDSSSTTIIVAVLAIAAAATASALLVLGRRQATP
jgi:hypothetical protein